ncbi:hypothetical protein THAOC_18176 [Thalassiosira oceanica]|uniref:Uncharacterized protein n=1 Tax=Thalassiosira oceanica TaxID=159749 RepID=K0S5H8_THAOC|nr:hypothetical protein THAOC_18176 [Thalassiosira oceanica]|eukprot:EJK61353.1 hypothetical protein THAOC_18176 [Thalassiosira oceanica]
MVQHSGWLCVGIAKPRTTLSRGSRDAETTQYTWSPEAHCYTSFSHASVMSAKSSNIYIYIYIYIYTTYLS